MSPLKDSWTESRMPRSASVFRTGFFRSMVKRTRSPEGTPVLMNEITQSMSRKLVANLPSWRALRSAGLSPSTFFQTTKSASAVGRSMAGRASQIPSTRYRGTAPWAEKSMRIRSARELIALARSITARGYPGSCRQAISSPTASSFGTPAALISKLGTWGSPEVSFLSAVFFFFPKIMDGWSLVGRDKLRRQKVEQREIWGVDRGEF